MTNYCAVRTSVEVQEYEFVGIHRNLDDEGGFAFYFSQNEKNLRSFAHST